MKAVIQRVDFAKVEIEDKLHDEIGKGLLLLIGIEEIDNEEDIEWLAGKISRLRIFDDENGVMNMDVNQIKGDVMIISQFTLHASTKKGNRPSYIKAARPETAIPIFEKFISKIRENISGKIALGQFGAHMNISLLNNGPVTILIDTKNKE